MDNRRAQCLGLKKTATYLRASVGLLIVIAAGCASLPDDVPVSNIQVAPPPIQKETISEQEAFYLDRARSAITKTREAARKQFAQPAQ